MVAFPRGLRASSRPPSPSSTNAAGSGTTCRTSYGGGASGPGKTYKKWVITRKISRIGKNCRTMKFALDRLPSIDYRRSDPVTSFVSSGCARIASWLGLISCKLLSGRRLSLRQIPVHYCCSSSTHGKNRIGSPHDTARNQHLL